MSTSAPADVNAAFELSRLIASGWIAQALHAAAALGVADALAAGPTTAAAIAPGIGADPDALQRLLRSLTAIGLCRAHDDARYELTPVGACLRRDSPLSMHSWALLMGTDTMRETWARLPTALRTGEPSADLPADFEPFSFLASQRPEYAANFYAAMSELTTLSAATVVQAYDFSPFATVIDVGGGHGALLAAILRSAPAARGVLFDLPHLREAASALAERARVADRWTFESGTFFDAVPQGGDVYILKSVIHDWSDEESLSILRQVRAAMHVQACLLLVEMVIPEPVEPTARDAMIVGTDLGLLAMLSGRERTAASYRALLEGSGFVVSRFVPTNSAFDVIEARPAR